MKKILQIVGIFALIFVIMIGISVISLMKSDNKSTINASAEEIEEAVKQMGSGILDGGFYLDGKVYQLPVMVSDLMDGGWIFDAELRKQFGEFPANTVTNVTNIGNENDNQKLISIALINPFEEKKKLKDVYVEMLSISKFTANKIILPQGITWKSTLEEVEAAYGEPSDKSTDASGASIVYENEIWEISIYFNTGDDGKSKMSKVSYRLKY